MRRRYPWLDWAIIGAMLAFIIWFYLTHAVYGPVYRGGLGPISPGTVDHLAK